MCTRERSAACAVGKGCACGARRRRRLRPRESGAGSSQRKSRDSGALQRLLWPVARGGGAAAGVYTALKFGGLALRVASGLAASIGRDAERALSQLEPPAEPLVRLSSDRGAQPELQ
jgi:hypothetical protein